MGSDDVQPGRSEGEDELQDQTVDEMFAQMMASYHLTAPGHDRAAPPGSPFPGPAGGGTDGAGDASPLPRPAVRRPDPPRSWAPRSGAGRDEEHPLSERPGPKGEPDESFERYRPDPQPPMGWPRWPVLLGWVGMVWALAVALLVIFGISLPGWTGGLAVLSFLGGFGLLVSQLPRHRPPDSGDGAVL